MTLPLVRVSEVRKYFSGGTWRQPRPVKAVDNVSFDIEAGETLGLVGESGSGKSTLGRVIVGLSPATSGRGVIAGTAVQGLRGRQRRALWRHTQMVFQDPYSALNPRLTVRDTLAEPLRNFAIAQGGEAERLIRKMLDVCGLPASAMDRYPVEFSGGQRQRIGIARALIPRPAFIVADEPVSALDVSIQAQIINLMQDLKVEFNLTYLFIAHDLAVVRHVSNRVAVMYRGKVVEIGRAEQIYANPMHPYTRLLLRSVPIPDPKLEAERLRGYHEVVNSAIPEDASGCQFAPRCPLARSPLCLEEPPLSARTDTSHLVACHLADGQRDTGH